MDCYVPMDTQNTVGFMWLPTDIATLIPISIFVDFEDSIFVHPKEANADRERDRNKDIVDVIRVARLISLTCKTYRSTLKNVMRRVSP